MSLFDKRDNDSLWVVLGSSILKEIEGQVHETLCHRGENPEGPGSTPGTLCCQRLQVANGRRCGFTSQPSESLPRLLSLVGTTKPATETGAAGSAKMGLVCPALPGGHPEGWSSPLNNPCPWLCSGMFINKRLESGRREAERSSHGEGRPMPGPGALSCL